MDMRSIALADHNLPLLAVRAQKGDRAAFEQIVRATARLVYARIVESVHDRQKAEDLTQETYLLAWRHIGGLQSTGTDGAGVVSWLLTLARNATLDAVKYDHRQKRAAGRTVRGDGPRDGQAIAAKLPTPAESAELAEAREHALGLLAELPEEYRRVLSMRYLGGAEYAVIRSALGLSDGALRGLLTRGMAILRERMTRRERDKVTR